VFSWYILNTQSQRRTPLQRQITCLYTRLCSVTGYMRPLLSDMLKFEISSHAHNVAGWGQENCISLRYMKIYFRPQATQNIKDRNDKVFFAVPGHGCVHTRPLGWACHRVALSYSLFFCPFKPHFLISSKITESDDTFQEHKMKTIHSTRNVEGIYTNIQRQKWILFLIFWEELVSSLGYNPNTIVLVSLLLVQVLT